MFKLIFLTIFFLPNVLFSSNLNEIFFLPKQNEELKDKIVDLISTSKKSIKISMYNFSYKKFAKELVDASKNGVKIKIILDKEKVEKDDEIYKYLKDNKITIIIPKEKLHTKIAVFDDETMLIGSLNWTKESFENNYEVVLISKDKEIINEMKFFINSFN